MVCNNDTNNMGDIMAPRSKKFGLDLNLTKGEKFSLKKYLKVLEARQVLRLKIKIRRTK